MSAERVRARRRSRAERAQMAGDRDPGTTRRDGGNDRDQGRQNDRREHERPSRSSAASNGSAHPASKARTAMGADSVRRRLSSIFQRPIAGMAPRRPIRVVGLRPAPEDPGQQLPIAARPAVVAKGADVVAGRKFLDDLDIGGETGAGEHTLEQIVAEQRRVPARGRRARPRRRRRRRCPCRRRSLHRTDPDRRRRRPRHRGRCRSCSRRCAGTASPPGRPAATA